MEHTKRTPVTQGAAKVPVIIQMEALECGAACLAMILAYYGKWVPLEKMRVDCGVSRDGSNARNLLLAARSYGLDAWGCRFEVEELKKNGQFPCVIHWNFCHFVVLNGFHKGRAVINDPARGTCRISMEEFDRSFTGICLQFVPSPRFLPGGKPRSIFDYAKARLTNARPAILLMALCTLITGVIGLIAPGFVRICFDRLLTGQNPDWAYPSLGMLSLIALILLAVRAVQAVYANKLNGKMEVVGNLSFMHKLLHLPMDFFQQRTAEDIQERQNANGRIAGLVIRTVVPLALNGLMLIFYLAVMIRYNWQMSLMGVTAVVLNIGLLHGIRAKRDDLARVMVRDQAKLSAAATIGVDMIETIKTSGAENVYFEYWAGRQAAVCGQKAKYVKRFKYLSLLPGIVTVLANGAVVMAGVYFAMHTDFTLGMIVAFQGYLNAFMAPAMQMAAAGQTLHEANTALERIEDVMKHPADPVWESQTETEDNTQDKLLGPVVMKNVTFGYSHLAEPLIRDFSMTLEAGRSIALIGASGCGKTTVAKLLSGLYKPWQGEIRIADKPIDKIRRNVFTASVAVVDQDTVLFEDTIASNIRMWDESIEDFAMILAARDAQIHDDIMARPGGYRSMLSEGGRDLSGGQRQQLEIARVLAQEPTLIIMDEATAALDAQTEHDVISAIRERGIACVMIAHRLSAVRDCDEIIVMDQGRIAERGTHEELMARGGIYTQLVTDD